MISFSQTDIPKFLVVIFHLFCFLSVLKMARLDLLLATANIKRLILLFAYASSLPVNISSKQSINNISRHFSILRPLPSNQPFCFLHGAVRLRLVQWIKESHKKMSLCRNAKKSVFLLNLYPSLPM